MRRALRRARRWARIALTCLASLASVAVWGADPAVHHWGLVSSPVELPSLWRVLWAFLVTVALVAALSVFIRRRGWAWGRSTTTGSGIVVRSRLTSGPGLRLTVVEVEGSRLLIAESRQGLQVVVLDQGPRA